MTNVQQSRAPPLKVKKVFMCLQVDIYVFVRNLHRDWIVSSMTRMDVLFDRRGTTKFSVNQVLIVKHSAHTTQMQTQWQNVNF